jgi:poly(3-hydroxybutyrate) depolymerase
MMTGLRVLLSGYDELAQVTTRLMPTNTDRSAGIAVTIGQSPVVTAPATSPVATIPSSGIDSPEDPPADTRWTTDHRSVLHVEHVSWARRSLGRLPWHTGPKRKRSVA